MHWCYNETLILMSIISFVGVSYRRLRAWYDVKFTKCNHIKCDNLSIKYTGYCTKENMNEERIQILNYDFSSPVVKHDEFNNTVSKDISIKLVENKD